MSVFGCQCGQTRLTAPPTAKHSWRCRPAVAVISCVALVRKVIAVASVKLGLIGMGAWARRAYLPIIRELPDVDVVAVAAPSESTQKLARETFGHDIAAYSAYDGLLSDSTVQAVFIALPNSLHAEVIEAAVACGKDVFFEPPAGLHRDQIDRTLKMMRGSGQVVQPDLELRHLPVMSAVDHVVASGVVGRLLMARVRLWCDWGFGGGGWGQDVEDEGFFLWLGCWYLDVLDVIFKTMPTQVNVMGGRAMNGRLLDHGWATLVYPDEALGQFEFNLVSGEGTEVTVHVAGTEGEIVADLQEGMCRWRQKGKAWQTQSCPCSQPVHGFVGMRESITHFVHAVREGQDLGAEVEACGRVHQAALMCHAADTGRPRG